MSDYVTLMGSEEVSRAGSRIAGAAGDMQRAADTMDNALERFGRAQEEHAGRMELILDKFLAEFREIVGTSLGKQTTELLAILDAGGYLYADGYWRAIHPDGYEVEADGHAVAALKRRGILFDDGGRWRLHPELRMPEEDVPEPFLDGLAVDKAAP
jgi:hypothetical protein